MVVWLEGKLLDAGNIDAQRGCKSFHPSPAGRFLSSPRQSNILIPGNAWGRGCFLSRYLTSGALISTSSVRFFKYSTTNLPRRLEQRPLRTVFDDFQTRLGSAVLLYVVASEVSETQGFDHYNGHVHGRVLECGDAARPQRSLKFSKLSRLRNASPFIIEST